MCFWFGAEEGLGEQCGPQDHTGAREGFNLSAVVQPLEDVGSSEDASTILFKAQK